MLTKEEIDLIISNKNGGMEAIYEIARQSYLKGFIDGMVYKGDDKKQIDYEE